MPIDACFREGALPLSFEVFPPKGELALDQAERVIGELAPLSPAFVSVTCSAGGSGNSANTVAVASLVQNRFEIPALAHLTCMGATAQDIAARLAALSDAGVGNVLALRGDPVPGAALADFRFAKDLIPVAVREGFCVGAAAYPEGHIDCLDFKESLEHLRQKQDAGARFLVTQLCFDNDQALAFLEAARNAAITIPITFGIMPFLSKDQISRMVFTCGAGLPSAVIKLLARWEHDPDSLRAAGIEYACDQLAGLAEAGVDGLHVYTMNRPEIARAAAEALACYR